MNILLLTPCFPPEIMGCGHLYHELAETLVKKGHKVTVITSIPRRRLPSDAVRKQYRGKLFLGEIIDGIHVIRIGAIPLPLDIPVARGLDHFLSALTYFIGGLFAPKQDVIIVYSPPLTLGLTSYLLGKLRKIPFVFNVQDLFPKYVIDIGALRNPFLIKLFEGIESLVYKHATYISLHSMGNRDYLVSQGIEPTKLTVIPNWTDIESIKPSEKYNDFRQEHNLDDLFVISYAGTMGQAQDMDVIIECAALLKEHKDILFLLVGEGSEKKPAMEKAAALNLDNVKFLPIQPREKYPSVLHASDVCLANLKKEITTPVVPSKILNIMASGRPVAASFPLGGDAPQIINEANCGLCVEAGDAIGLAGGILKLYNDRDLANRLGRNGRVYAEDNFSRTVCIDRYENLCHQAINL